MGKLFANPYTKLNIQLPHDPANNTHKYRPQKILHMYTKHMYINVHRSFTYEPRKKETQIHINRGITE